MKRHARILTGLLAALTACALLAGCGASSASNTAIAEIDRAPQPITSPPPAPAAGAAPKKA